MLREADLRLDLTRRIAACFADGRQSGRVEHGVQELVAQRVHGLALGYEDLNDHDRLRSDPLLALAAGKADPSGLKRARARDRGHVLAGSSTLNRLELGEPKARETRWRYSKIVADGEALDRLLVKLFLESHAQAPGTVWLDLDATDDPLHGAQEGRFPSRGHGPGIAAVPGLPLPHARVLEPHAPGGGQGGMVEEGSQPALRGHQPAPRGCRRPIPVREVVLRARGHGEQDQGMPVGSVRRPHQYGDAARQSTTLALRRLRLRADARVAQRRSAARSGSAG